MRDLLGRRAGALVVAGVLLGALAAFGLAFEGAKIESVTAWHAAAGDPCCSFGAGGWSAGSRFCSCLMERQLRERATLTDSEEYDC